VKIKIAGVAELETALAKVAGADTKSRISEAAVTVLQSMAELNFRSDRNRPVAWPDFAESTKKSMSKKRKKNPKLLIDNATLLRSLSVEDDADGASLVSAVDYAGYHQYGAPKAKVPARPFVPVTGEYGKEATPTPEAEKRMRKAAEAALKVELGKLFS
jgi:phage gpG-like protein